MEEDLQRTGKRNIIIGGLWLIGGITVTAGTYVLAASSSSGGTYAVTLGPILYGGVRLLYGILQIRQTHAGDDAENALPSERIANGLGLDELVSQIEDALESGDPTEVAWAKEELKSIPQEHAQRLRAKHSMI